MTQSSSFSAGSPHDEPVSEEVVLSASIPSSDLRPLLSKGRPLPELPEGAKCLRCRQRATLRLPNHHANFCPECFLRFFEQAVTRAMKKMALPEGMDLLVAVSGGKDSLALWDVLHTLGYPTRGLHIDLGIEDFSDRSLEAVDRFARERGLSWTSYSLKELFGYTVPEVHQRMRRKICGLCGLLKRQLLNRLTIREGYRTIALGHNLDDEAGRLLGNLVRHRDQYLQKHYPILPSTHPRLPTKVKPLYRLEAYEILLYCEIRGIEPLRTKCPLSRGATSHTYKEALNFLEQNMPGTKRHFLFSFFNKQKPAETNGIPFVACKQCGEPAFTELCSVCHLASQLRAVDQRREDLPEQDG